MLSPAVKTGFTIVCLLGIAAIGFALTLDISRVRRGQSALSAHQLRIRVISALIWTVALGSLCYAVLFLWPQPGQVQQGRRLLAIFSGSFLLILIALSLVFYDMMLLARKRRQHDDQFERNLEALASGELDRLQHDAPDASPHAGPDNSSRPAHRKNRLPGNGTAP